MTLPSRHWLHFWKAPLQLALVALFSNALREPLLTRARRSAVVSSGGSRGQIAKLTEVSWRVRSNRSPAVSTHEHVPTGSHGNALCKVAESTHLAIASAVRVCLSTMLCPLMHVWLSGYAAERLIASTSGARVHLLLWHPKCTDKARRMVPNVSRSIQVCRRQIQGVRMFPGRR